LTQPTPLWPAAQLLADWWSDPFDAEASGTESRVPTRARTADSTSSSDAVATALLLDVEPELLAQLGLAVNEPGLVEEHERLFVGPGRTPCPPYESMWHDDAPSQRGIMMGTAAGAVLALYRQAGLTMRPHPGELPDHLVVECEALAWCLAGDRAPTVARSLLTEHLLLWLPRFCERVAAETAHPYYQTLAAVTPGWMSALADQLERRPAGP
jgi:TorA maturation chaperone TorD